MYKYGPIYLAFLICALNTTYGVSAGDSTGGTLGPKLTRTTSTSSTGSYEPQAAPSEWSLHTVDSRLAELYNKLRGTGLGLRESIKKIEDDLQPDSDLKTQIRGLTTAAVVGLVTFIRYGPIFGGAGAYIFLISTDPAKASFQTIAFLVVGIYSYKSNRSISYLALIASILSYLQWL